MKKIIFITLAVFLLFNTRAYSVTETPTPKISSSITQGVISPSPIDKIQQLKDRVASRVAELKKDKLGAITGLLKSSSENALILTVGTEDFSVQLDEDTKIFEIDQNFKKKTISLSDIEKDEKITVIGKIEKEDKTATANVIVIRSTNITIFGTVKEINSTEGTMTVETKDQKTYIVDIEITTKINIYDPKEIKLNKLGLSKIEKGYQAFVYATPNIDDKLRITGLRITILPEAIASSTPSLSPSVNEASQGAKLTTSPTVKTTPKLSPTVKPTATPASN